MILIDEIMNIYKLSPLIQVLDGTLHEMRFAWPNESEEEQEKEMENIGYTHLKTDDVTYMNGNMLPF